MGKNKNSNFKVLDTRTGSTVDVDSKEEILTYKWLIQAQSLGVVKDFVYQPKTFLLSESVTYINSKNKKRTLFQDHVYSPDFLITINKGYQDLEDEFKYMDDNSIYVDVKGGFNRNSRNFMTDRKWVFQKYGIYIYELQPKLFFKKFGICPEFMFTEKTKKPSKVFQGFPLITDVFKSV